MDGFRERNNQGGVCVNKEQLEARRAELQQGLEQQQRNAIATHGAIQECDYWIAQLEGVKDEPLKLAGKK